MSDELMLTIEACAVRGRISGSVVRKLIRSGVLPAVRFSHRTLRVPADAFEQFIASRVNEAEAERATRATRTAQRHAAIAARKRAS
jgi:excisionase family DNA binding protein